MISTGSSHVSRTVATTVGNDRVRLLAPNKITRRYGVITLNRCLAWAVYRIVLPPMISVILQGLETAVGEEAEHETHD